MEMMAEPHGALKGRARVPGDKSISHRALMLAALAVGESRIEGLLEGEDVLATARALRALGVALVRDAPGVWRVHGVGTGGLAEPEEVLDLGNAGTAARLLLGILAGHGFTSFLSGDASLRRRPMGRVVRPLREMGAQILCRSGERLPLAITGRVRLLPIVWRSEVASAQVKSAILLAGLHAPGKTTVIEPLPSRDHTERMLRGMGASVAVEALPEGGQAISIEGEIELSPQSFTVPADPSSAFFPAVAAAVTPGSEILLEEVCLNPTRTGAYEVLAAMGAEITVVDRRELAGEPVGTLRVRGDALKAVDVPAERAPSMIDEYPALFVAAACARGKSRFRGLAELRVKESDRLAKMAEGLSACGVRCAIEGDDLWIEGGPVRGGAEIDAALDHRIAMSFLVLGGLARLPVRVRGAETIATSFPGFADLMNGLGARIRPLEASA